MTKSHSLLLALGLIGFSAGLAASARAQAGMAEDERSVLSLNPSSNAIDQRNGNGVVYNSGGWSPTPLTYSYDAHNDGSGGASDDIAISNYVNYGALSVSAQGDANSSSQTGAFTWAQTYIGGDITLGFRDVITPLEDMQVTYTYTVSGANSSIANADGGTYALTDTLLEFGTANVRAELDLNGTVTYTGTLDLVAGNPYSLFVGLGYDCAANSNDLSSDSSSFNSSANGTFSLDVLTPGTSFNSLSGYRYGAPTPEPAGLLLLVPAVLAIRRKRAV